MLVESRAPTDPGPLQVGVAETRQRRVSKTFRGSVLGAQGYETMRSELPSRLYRLPVARARRVHIASSPKGTCQDPACVAGHCCDEDDSLPEPATPAGWVAGSGAGTGLNSPQVSTLIDPSFRREWLDELVEGNTVLRNKP